MYLKEIYYNSTKENWSKIYSRNAFNGGINAEVICTDGKYKIENDELKFLLVHQNNSHFSFPKGHMEDGETEVETALREIKEETNLDVDIDTNFRFKISYIIESKNKMKDAVYFVATPITFNLKPQEGEITSCDWYDYNTTFDSLEFDNAKDVLKKAYSYIKNKKY